MKSTRERVGVSLLVGVLAFALISTNSKNGTGLGAGVVVAIVVWLLTAPREKKSE